MLACLKVAIIQPSESLSSQSGAWPCCYICTARAELALLVSQILSRAFCKVRLQTASDVCLAATPLLEHVSMHTCVAGNNNVGRGPGGSSGSSGNAVQGGAGGDGGNNNGNVANGGDFNTGDFSGNGGNATGNNGNGGNGGVGIGGESSCCAQLQLVHVCFQASSQQQKQHGLHGFRFCKCW